MPTCGWIKLHRKLLDSRVFVNEGLLKTWVWCLLKANHETEWVPVKTGKGTTEVKIEPGQFIFGRKTAAKELKMKLSTVWKRMLKLETTQNLNIQRNTHYSIVCIINWECYQSKEKPKGTGKGTGREQAGNTNKNDKNIYTDKSKKFVGDYISFILKTYPTKAPKGKNITKNSLETINKLTRIDKFEEEYIFNALRWAQKDDFWSTQIYSLASLRNKSRNNGLTKFQNLSNSYDKDKPEQAKPKIPFFEVAANDR